MLIKKNRGRCEMTNWRKQSRRSEGRGRKYALVPEKIKIQCCKKERKGRPNERCIKKTEKNEVRKIDDDYHVERVAYVCNRLCLGLNNFSTSRMKFVGVIKPRWNSRKSLCQSVLWLYLIFYCRRKGHGTNSDLLVHLYHVHLQIYFLLFLELSYMQWTRLFILTYWIISLGSDITTAQREMGIFIDFFPSTFSFHH